MQVVKLIILPLIALMITSGCTSQGIKRFGYDVLSNYQCSSTGQCSNFTNAHMYQTMHKSQCLGSNSLPGCEDSPPLNYDEYVDEREEALEDIKGNK